MLDNPRELAIKVSKIIDDKKGQNIKILDVKKQSSIAEYFVLATGTSTRHGSALADEIEKKLSEFNIVVNHKEGYSTGRWILLDYLDIVVHIFVEEERNFYNLERIWKDAKYVEIN